jgi:AP endonuclease-1
LISIGGFKSEIVNRGMCPHEPHDGATTALFKSPDHKGGHKRQLSNGTSDNSPARRSKRQRSSINLKEPSSPTSDPEVEDVDLPVKEEAELVVTKKIQRSVPVKVEADEDAKSVATPKGGKKRKTAVKKEETETIVEKKPSKRGKKTQGDKESDAMPLASRTQGLRMFVGAHVSAAKGELGFVYFK